MNRQGLTILAFVVANPAFAQDPLPDLQSCINKETARFERNLSRAMASGKDDRFDVGGVSGVDHCGTLGIVRCDRGADPYPCQHALGAEQDALSAAILATLPSPEAVAGSRGQWSDALYPLVLSLAQGRSAGPDCAGDLEAIEAWCVARNATHRLAAATLAWQLARYLGAAPSGVDAGWAGAPDPTRPQKRPGSDGSKE